MQSSTGSKIHQNANPEKVKNEKLLFKNGAQLKPVKNVHFSIAGILGVHAELNEPFMNLTLT